MSAAVESPDAALLAACATFQARRSERITAYAEEDDAAQDAAHTAEWAAFDHVAALPPATTDAGRAAKAAVAVAMTERHVHPSSTELDEDLLFARRVLGEIAARTSPDADLIAACARYEQLEAAVRAMPDEDFDAPKEYYEVFRAIANLPARTPEGQRAKAEAILCWHGGTKPHGGDANADLCDHQRVEWSLVLDVAGRAQG